jgi:hypothetical protein
MGKTRPTWILLLLVAAGAVSVAEQPERVGALEPLRADRRLRATYPAGAPDEDLKGFGGFGFARFGNLARPLPPGVSVPKGSLSLIAQPEVALLWGEHLGFRLLLANTTGEPVRLVAQDSLLSILRQAQDEHGVWRDLEYMPESSCGNSYHTVRLHPGRAWRFAVPQFEGPLKTQMRFVLAHKGQTIVSNTFEGRIDPRQFEGMQGHRPTDMMDPYRE